MPDIAPIRPSAALPTSARLSLGASSGSVSTREHLRFQLDHALARDAVHTELDVPLLLRGLRERGLEGLALRSAALDRKTYLLRPDLGRTLHSASIATLEALDASAKPVISTEGPTGRSRETPVSRTAKGLGAPGLDSETWVKRPRNSVLFLIADGLSALAVERHALPLLDATLPLISARSSLIPILTNARVAIADPIGRVLGAQMTVLLIGERPGLSSPDSLGVYLTWEPRPGRTDAERNCISNIRSSPSGEAEGLSYAEAAHRIAHYIREAQRLHTTGIALKDPANAPALPAAGPLA